MPIYRAPLEDTLFILNDLLGMQRHADLPGFADATPDTVEAILSEAGRFCEEILLPLNRIGDREGCTRRDDGRVTTPQGFKAAYECYAAAGWVGLAADPDVGGQGLPYTLAAAVSEFASSANMAWAMYPGLTQGAIAALTAHGTDRERALYLPKLVSGAWTGTMNLTEPHCGTDLGLLRTKAVPNGDGSYAISGTKIFISAGEHDLTENIVHLVLARIQGAPEAVKGISLFVVPKRLPDEAGDPGAPNGVSCGSIEAKMGIHGNATCVMNYDNARGWLIGEAHKGLRAMFTMMNEARLGVGIQGLAQAEVAYQNAAAYTKDRIQGRALTGPKAPDRAADPIIVHPDVRRTLMTIRSIVDAGRALVLYTALQSDVAHRSKIEAERLAAEDFLGLMTPVIKGVLTDKGFECAVMAQQMLGGHGYIAEWGMEQFVRDARIAMIYEGANGIQALDLVGRKLPANGGRAITALFKELGAFCAARAADPDLAPLVTALQKSVGDLQKATMWFMANGPKNPDDAGAASTDYMHLLGLVMLGWMWVRMAETAGLALKTGDDSRTAFLERKRVMARFFAERMLPETGAHLARISAGSASIMALPADAF